MIATGFIAAGPWDFVGHVELREGTVDKLKTRLLDRDDMVASTMSTFVSLTVHCARCHDHKFDPIPQTDYYRLQAVFAGVDRGDRPYRSPERARRAIVHAEEADGLRRPAARAPPDPVLAPRRRRAARRAGRRRDAGVPPGSCRRTFSLCPIPTTREAAAPPWPTGSPARETCSPGVRSPIASGTTTSAAESSTRPTTSAATAPLPTHPELLDWLAVELRDSGQSLKTLHRLIVCSAVYRQASRDNPASRAIDADNRYLWRQNRRRLDAEAVRDSVLAVCRHARPPMGGPGFELFRFKDDHSPIYDHTDPARSTIPRCGGGPSIASSCAACRTRSWRRSTAPTRTSTRRFAARP